MLKLIIYKFRIKQKIFLTINRIQNSTNKSKLISSRELNSLPSATIYLGASSSLNA